MDPFTRVSGVAAALPGSSIDTDVIMPKKFLKGIDRAGLSRGVFHDLRFGEAAESFVLNRQEWRDAKFLVVGPNFGCGSSREHAVWGLLQLGIRAIIGTSFAGIFFDNCTRNGLLALTLSDGDIQSLMLHASDPTKNRFEIDLEGQKISSGCSLEIKFEIDSRRKRSLMLGLDAIGETLLDAPLVQEFEQAYFLENPWLAGGVGA
ncbi:3-isopropylmalate dehydratase small subunit [Bosea sp. 2KB_26]|uniref:3-isopropylmalate dehydratase small subunit n=1 Tax=Bosea sp. 2KB_26 TaxID=3237475 RepID=UPI003F8DCA8D